MSVGAEPRRRAWLVAAMTMLLVGIYLVGWMTYARLHLPPDRYVSLPPGASATQGGVEFRLTSLRRTERFTDTFGKATAPPPDTEWVVAELEATVRNPGDKPICPLALVDDRRRTWEKTLAASVSRELKDCVPDATVAGQTYLIETYFQVPSADVDHLVGLAVDQFSTRPDPLLRPAD